MTSGRRRRRGAWFAAVVIVGSALSTGMTGGPATRPAGATVPTEIIHDAVGDVANPRGDIVTAGAGTDAEGYAFSVHVVMPVDPRTDVNWKSGLTHVEWDLDTNLDGDPDAFATLSADGAGNLHAVMERSSDQFVYCTGTASYTASHDYLATFPVGCVPGVAHFRWSVIFDYDTGTPQNDVAPDLSFTQVHVLGKVGYWMLGFNAQELIGQPSHTAFHHHRPD